MNGLRIHWRKWRPGPLEHECTEDSWAECYDALIKFQSGKGPRNNGLTVDFFKGFWNVLSQQRTDCLNFSFEHGELSNSQRHAVIWLI